MNLSLGLSKLINFNSKTLSLKLFNQRLPFIYILFNFFYKKFIVNKKINENLLKFHNLGFTKLNVNFSSLIDEYKDKFYIKPNNDKTSPYKSEISLHDQDKKDFIFEIKKRLKPEIVELEKYFNCDIIISDIKLSRNFYHKDQNNLNIEHYSNHFHQDSYLMTYNKIFINLMDIKEDDGPLEIIPYPYKKLFIKSFKYKDRNNYNSDGDASLIYKNVGKKGDTLLFSSSRLFHRAGVPKKFRDNLAIIIITLPKYKRDKLNKIDDIQLFDENYKHFQKFVKPYSIIKVSKLFLEFYKYKFKKNNEQNTKN